MHTMLLKAALPSIPVVNQLPGVRKTGGDPSSLHELRTATVTREHVAAYARVCGFPVKDTAPLTFPHVLAFPLHMAVMTSPEFPFPAIGTVHLANSITRHRPIDVGETLQIEVHASPVRPHPKGQAVDFLATARVDGETVWESTSTYLRRGRSSADGVVSTGSTDVTGRPTRATWCPDGSRGGWAATSAAGTPRCPATTTRSTSTRSPPRPWASAVRSRTGCGASPAASRRWRTALPDAVTVDAAFTKPIFLPGTVMFGQDAVDDEDGIAFALTSPKGGTPHLVGRTRAGS